MGLWSFSHSGAGLAPPLVCHLLIDWLTDTVRLGCSNSGLGVCVWGRALPHQSMLQPVPLSHISQNISRHQPFPTSDTPEYPGVLSLLSGEKEEGESLSCALLYPEWSQGTASVFAEFSSTIVSKCSPQLWPFPSLTHTHPCTYPTHWLVLNANYLLLWSYWATLVTLHWCLFITYCYKNSGDIHK